MNGLHAMPRTGPKPLSLRWLDFTPTLVARAVIILTLWPSTILFPVLGIAAAFGPPEPTLAPRFRVVYYPGSRFSLRLAAAPGAPQAGGPQGTDQISVRAFDSVNNALRINATLQPG